MESKFVMNEAATEESWLSEWICGALEWDSLDSLFCKQRFIELIVVLFL